MCYSECSTVTVGGDMANPKTIDEALEAAAKQRQLVEERLVANATEAASLFDDGLITLSEACCMMGVVTDLEG